jgi:hypothetical protein
VPAVELHFVCSSSSSDLFGSENHLDDFSERLPVGLSARSEEDLLRPFDCVDRVVQMLSLLSDDLALLHCSPAPIPSSWKHSIVICGVPSRTRSFMLPTSPPFARFLRADADQDPELDRRYHLDDEEIAMQVARFGRAFDRCRLRSADLAMGQTARY